MKNFTKLVYSSLIANYQLDWDNLIDSLLYSGGDISLTRTIRILKRRFEEDLKEAYKEDQFVWSAIELALQQINWREVATSLLERIPSWALYSWAEDQTSEEDVPPGVWKRLTSTQKKRLVSKWGREI